MRKLFALFIYIHIGLSAQIEYFESVLPIIIINTNNQTILDETRITCNMGVIHNANGVNSIMRSSPSQQIEFITFPALNLNIRY